MKRTREIILDFTSLLDVVLVILFFFIMYSRFEITEVKKSMEESKLAAEAVVEEYEGKMDEADKMLSDADRLLDEIKAADERKAANIEGIDEFSKGMNIRLNLIMGEESWKLSVYRGDGLLSEIPYADDGIMKNKLCEIIAGEGFTSEDTLLCEFIYDATESGTASAYRHIGKVLDLVKNEYEHFYCSEIDISVRNEG